MGLTNKPIYSPPTQYWLDLEKPLNRQVGLSLVEPMLRFCVKFYAADPAQLEEEFTRSVWHPTPYCSHLL